MYWGRFEGKLEGKNRIAFPAKLREVMGSDLLIANWFEQTLIILPLLKADELVWEWTRESTLKQEIRDLETFIFGGSQVVALDFQGRFILPRFLREHAKIKKDVLFTGGISYVRLWSREVFENYFSLTVLKSGNTAAKVAEMIENKESVISTKEKSHD